MRLATTMATTVGVICALAATRTAYAFPEDGRPVRVNCDHGHKTITRALERAREGDTIQVTGACKESLVIDKAITLEGIGGASIAPAAPQESTITVSARDVTIRGFSLESPALFQLFVYNAALVIVHDTTIRHAQNFGISAAANSNVVLLGNTIMNNGLGGIIGLSGAEFMIGSHIAFDPPRPNLIANNSSVGLVLVGGAGARILGGNTFSGHNVGILVQDGSQARIAGNVIDGNNIGILVDSGATVQLPLVSNPVPLFTELNSGTNTSYGIACRAGTIRGVPDGLAPAVRLPATPGVLSGPTDGLTTHCLDQTVSLPASP
jgi:nitrous oxidase accessory protein NosD